jgi:CheY-like chemotaxis protein
LRQQSVLYVEDEPLIAMDGEEILREMGFEDIVKAFSFAQAQEAMEGKAFDFALLDVNLGRGQTSLPLADTLLSRGTRVLFASGYSSSEALRDRLGAQLIQKPFNETTLRDALIKAWALEETARG